jgi:hypothetical protein
MDMVVVVVEEWVSGKQIAPRGTIFTPAETGRTLTLIIARHCRDRCGRAVPPNFKMRRPSLVRRLWPADATATFYLLNPIVPGSPFPAQVALRNVLCMYVIRRTCPLKIALDSRCHHHYVPPAERSSYVHLVIVIHFVQGRSLYGTYGASQFILGYRN